MVCFCKDFLNISFFSDSFFPLKYHSPVIILPGSAMVLLCRSTQVNATWCKAPHEGNGARTGM